MDPATITAVLALIPAQYLGYVLAAGGFCAWLMTVLKPPADTSPQWYRIVYPVLNFVGGNIGHARNVPKDAVIAQSAPPQVKP